MSLLKGLSARARSLLASGASEARMEEEFRFHIAMEAERLVAAGVAPDEARRRALVAFGGLDQHREAMRDGRGARLLADFGGDVRYALRAIRRSPGFAIAVAATLGMVSTGSSSGMSTRSCSVQFQRDTRISSSVSSPSTRRPARRAYSPTRTTSTSATAAVPLPGSPARREFR